MTTLFNRAIPCLLLQDGGLVKTVQFKTPQYVGDPINAVRIFNEKYVDELIFLDIDASEKKRQPNYDLIERLAGECFMPFCYGGGIKTVQQAKKIVALGVEKIAICSAAINNLDVLTHISQDLGSQSVVGVIDVKRTLFGKYRVYDASRRKQTPLDPIEFAKRMILAGAGEIMINDVDRDGTYQGYDTQLISRVSQAIEAPLIACGGAGSLEDMQSVFGAGASAAAAGSIFVFYGPHRAVLINYPVDEVIQKLKPKGDVYHA